MTSQDLEYGGGCNLRQSGIPTEPIEIARNMSVVYQKFRQQRLSLSKFRRQGPMVVKNPTCLTELVGKLGGVQHPPPPPPPLPLGDITISITLFLIFCGATSSQDPWSSDAAYTNY